MIFIFQMSLDIIVLFIVNFIPLQMMTSMHMTGFSFMYMY